MRQYAVSDVTNNLSPQEQHEALTTALDEFNGTRSDESLSRLRDTVNTMDLDTILEHPAMQAAFERENFTPEQETYLIDTESRKADRAQWGANLSEMGSACRLYNDVRQEVQEKRAGTSKIW